MLCEAGAQVNADGHSRGIAVIHPAHMSCIAPAICHPPGQVAGRGWVGRPVAGGGAGLIRTWWRPACAAQGFS